MPILVIEGFDGVGKTTVARAAARRLDGVVVTDTPLDDIWSAKRKVVNRGQDVEARFDYFLQLNRQYMSLARAQSDIGRVSVLDSSVFRTVATHRVLGSFEAEDYELDAGLIPDHTVLLSVDEPTRIARLRARDGVVVYNSEWDMILHGHVDEVHEQYRQFGLPVVDASVDVERVVDQVLEIYSAPLTR
jgi:thymidylate kinase